MKKHIATLVERSLATCFEKGLLTPEPLPAIEVEYPREEAHGDYATNIAMTLARSQRKNPRHIAETIIAHIDNAASILEKVELAGPGFINFFVTGTAWITLLKEIDEQGPLYGRSSFGENTRVQVEFVSANPTGPLHIGHARGAVVGDVIANILTATGHDVLREYYINDAGNQMNLLGRSVYYRYSSLLGKDVDFPPECYQGAYIADLARTLITAHGDTLLTPDGTVPPFFTTFAAQTILDEIKDDLRDFGVTFDTYFSEKTLYEENGVEMLLRELEEKGFIYREGPTRWFKTTDFGDEKDRVVVRDTGEPTYFAADIAYHRNKYHRGFDKIIDIWGADHHGYIPRMYAGIQAIGKSKESLAVILVQLVNLLRGGEPVAMSTRAGEFVTLREVLDEVGRDAARYNFLMRRSESHLDFDLELAKQQTNENPVYYVQYVHARIMSILRTAEERGYATPRYTDIDPSLLGTPEEFAIVKALTRYPELLDGCARSFEPHRITFYLNDLASLFHSYYNKHRVLSDDKPLSAARLFLVASIGSVVRNALGILGVSAPERM